VAGALAYYIHHLSPTIVDFGFVRPRWYGLAYLCGFYVAFLLLKKLSRDGMLRVQPDRVADLVLNACIFGVLIGGRLGYVLFYNLPNALKAGQTPMLWAFSAEPPFWGVLKVWEGGMSAHGGIVFTIVALAVIARREKWSLINIGDAACMVVPLGLFFGRLANFVNGELYGHPTTVAWGVKFPSEVWAPTNDVPTVRPDQLMALKQTVAQHLAAHPTDLTIQQAQAFLDAHKEMRGVISANLGGGLNLANSAHLEAAQRNIGMFLRMDPASILREDLARWWEHGSAGLTEAMRGVFETILPARHPSQLYEAMLEGALLFVICWAIGRVWRKDGMASGAFLTLYPVMRIIGEQFRVGDTPISIMGVEVSKGVMYSLPMVMAGMIFWGYWIKRDRRVPWMKPAETTPVPESTGKPA
jgi:phosphatidylglycerol:prolipoprotein diacylglycerol transferase